MGMGPGMPFPMGWRIIILRDFIYGGILRQPGDILDVSPWVARNIIEAGAADHYTGWTDTETPLPWVLQPVPEKRQSN